MQSLGWPNQRPRKLSHLESSARLSYSIIATRATTLQESMIFAVSRASETHEGGAKETIVTRNTIAARQTFGRSAPLLPSAPSFTQALNFAKVSVPFLPSLLPFRASRMNLPRSSLLASFGMREGQGKLVMWGMGGRMGGRGS